MKKNTLPYEKKPVKRTVGKIPKAGLISLVVSFVMALVLIILFFASSAGEGEAGSYVLVYGRSSLNGPFPYISLRNSLLAADHDLAVLENDEEMNDDRTAYVVPEKYRTRNIVVLTLAPNGFDIMKDLTSDEKNANVKGFVMINPSYPGNAALEGYSADVPDADIAFFGFKDSDPTPDDMSDVRTIFERMSGNDTVYQVATSGGGLFKSTGYYSVNQKRYLNLSNVTQGRSALLQNPVFQKELAEYIGLTFCGEYNSARVSVWFVLVLISLFLGLASMFFYLFFRPVLSVRNIDVLHKGRESLAEILVLGMSVWLPVLVIAGSFISYTESYVKYLVIISPEILFLVMILPRLRFLLSKQNKWERHDINLVRTFSQMALFIVMYTAVCLVFTDMSVSESSTSKLIWIAGIFACDTVLISLIALIDKKSRFVGEGGASYFGNLRYFLEVLIPPVATLIFAVIFARTKLALVAAYTLLSITVPYFAANEIRKSTDAFEVAGLVHGIMTAMTAYIIL